MPSLPAGNLMNILPLTCQRRQHVSEDVVFRQGSTAATNSTVWKRKIRDWVRSDQGKYYKHCYNPLYPAVKSSTLFTGDSVTFNTFLHVLKRVVSIVLRGTQCRTEGVSTYCSIQIRRRVKWRNIQSRQSWNEKLLEFRRSLTVWKQNINRPCFV